MKDKIINIENLTKDYGHGRGVFNVSIAVKEGECYGFLGPNGAGKTTTIRHLMGFSKPQEGNCSIMGRDCWKESAVLKAIIGYLPGEIAFPSGMTGTKFLKMMMKMRGMTDDTYCKQLLDRFELETDLDMDDMSLGMRRKLAVVTAFMHDPDILILDEPTSGLDPIMQQTFIDYIMDEKKRGKTIFMSSHIFEEIEDVCDRVSMIKDGNLIGTLELEEYRDTPERTFHISFEKESDLEAFSADNKFGLTKIGPMSVAAVFRDELIKEFMHSVSGVSITKLSEKRHTLEDAFMEIYEGGKK